MDPRARSPLAHRDPLTGDGLRLAERPFEGLLVLRGAPEAVGEPFAATAGLELPRVCRGTARGPGLTALWLSPDEWLLVTPTVADAEELMPKLEAALAGRHHQLVAVSDYHTVIELAGAVARDALAKLVAVDLHPRAWRRDEVLGTLLAKAAVQLWLVADEADPGGPTARLIVRRSLADHVWCLLAEAGREWGLPAQTPEGVVPLAPAAPDAARR
ncbi:MAG: sarcosine oxidase subunit gamma [Alphaproteobacteria bacterium]